MKFKNKEVTRQTFQDTIANRISKATPYWRRLRAADPFWEI